MKTLKQQIDNYKPAFISDDGEFICTGDPRLDLPIAQENIKLAVLYNNVNGWDNAVKDQLESAIKILIHHLD